MSAPKSIVIGASRGIGEGLVKKLGEQGYTSYGTIRCQPSNATTFQVDLNDPDAASVRKAAEQVDSLDLLVVNGAIAGKDPYLGISADRHREYYQTNVVGPLSAVQAFLPALRRGQQKTIVLISSLVGSFGLQLSIARSPADRKITFTNGPYSATKAALNHLGIGLFNELEKEGFSVLLIHPGLVRTDMGNASGLPERMDALGADAPFQAITVQESTDGVVAAIHKQVQSGTQKVAFLNYDGTEPQV